MNFEPQPLRRVERKRIEQAAQMRADIVDAAFSEFAERGYHQTTIADIAKRLGVSQGSFYNYFTGKREILEHVFQTLSARVTAALQAENAPEAPRSLEDHRAQALRIAAAFDAIAGTDPRVLRMLLLESASIDAEMAERMLSLFDFAGETAARYLRTGVERGFFRPDLDARATADLIVGMVTGVALRCLRSAPSADERAGLYKAVSRLLFDGITAKPSGRE